MPVEVRTMEKSDDWRCGEESVCQWSAATLTPSD